MQGIMDKAFRSVPFRSGLAMIGLLAFSSCATSSPDQLAAAPTVETASAPEMPAFPPDPLDPQVRALGSSVYASSCATCHDGGLGHAPSIGAIAALTPENVLYALTDGTMQQQAATLSDEEKSAVAQSITNRLLGSTQAAAPLLMCSGNSARFDRSEPPVFEGWGLDANNSHAIPTPIAGIGRDNVSRLRLKWAFAFPDAIDTRSQPALVGGAIYVGGADGTFYALDRESGCVRWTYQASSGVRTAALVSPWGAGDAEAIPLVYFGDNLGNAYALDAQSGAQVWKVRAGDHGVAMLTGTPALHGDAIYIPISSGEEGSAALPTYECCTFRGSVLALDRHTGEQLWRSYLVDEPVRQVENSIGTPQFGPSGVAVWSAPLIDEARGLLYVATGDNYSQPATELSDAIVALDMQTGAIRWSNQVTGGDSWNVGCWAGASGPNCPEDAGPDYDFGAAPLFALGADGETYLLAGQKSGIAYGFNPDTGEQVWETKVGRGGELGGIHFGIAADNGRLYVPVTDADNGAHYDEPARPGIYALDVASGELIWSAPADNPCDDRTGCQPGYSAGISVTDELVLAGSTDGHMRILDADNGAVLWDVDTAVAFETVNGTIAHGGSMSGGTAPIAYQGSLIVNSGYAFLGKMPGNVLLVYEVD